MTADFQLAPEATALLKPANHPSLDEFPKALAAFLPAATDADPDYDPATLAAWAVGYVAHARSEGYSEGSAAGIAGYEVHLAQVAEFATASGLIQVAPAFAMYLTGLAAVLRRNLNITEQYDLARTIEVEQRRVMEMVTGVLGRFPELGDGSLDRPEVAGADALILPGQ